ncbi:HVA22-like protein j [Gastrolobium bilobum]|uniref:HVA22-like protein j n=1 Tax=Gastrolobium bilobum TaxID=150636 RepID=UPI002AAF1E43|nr:HVA22-like protein j [Gastrolobium bilobum]
MLGDFITRCLILLLGYAYPGFECYKTVEKNRVDNEELRFWCQYWIIVALFTVLEKFADILIGWFPLYGEMKLALFIYLWYPKTKGTGYVYDTVLRPYVSSHESGIDKKFQEWRARAWGLAIFYWQNCRELGQSAFFQVLDFLAAQSTRFSGKNSTKKKYKQDPTPSAPPLPSIRSSFFENNQDNFTGLKKKKHHIEEEE